MALRCARRVDHTATFWPVLIPRYPHLQAYEHVRDHMKAAHPYMQQLNGARAKIPAIRVRCSHRQPNNGTIVLPTEAIFPQLVRK